MKPELTKSQEKALLDLSPFDPFQIGDEVGMWYKAVTWWGAKDLKKRLHKAGFNTPKLVVHLEAMVAQLKK